MMIQKAPKGAGQQLHNISILLYSISKTAIVMICTLLYTVYAKRQVTVFTTYVVHLFFLQVDLNPIVYFSLRCGREIDARRIAWCEPLL